MPSEVVKKYALISQTSEKEAEKVWRRTKHKFSEQGSKKDWTQIVESFKEALGLDSSDGTVAYFHGAKCIVIAEDPAFCLIQVQEIDKAPERLQKLLQSSNGSIVVNYEHLTLSPDGDPLGYPYQRQAMNETTTSVSVGNHHMKTQTQFPFNSGEIVKYGNKKALVCVPGDKKTKIHILNSSGSPSGEEKEVSNSSITIDSGYESFSNFLGDLKTSITENTKPKHRAKAFEKILCFETNLKSLPQGLNSFDNEDSSKDKKQLSVDDSDWKIVMDTSEDPSSSSLSDYPMPEIGNDPKKSSEEPQMDAEEDPSDDEVQSMMSKIKGESSLKIESLVDEAERLETAKLMESEGISTRLAEGTEEYKHERRQKVAQQWDNLLS